jgi:predicted nucleotidyltransferase
VESIKVFGSYLSDKDALGDLDVGVKLTRKHKRGDFTRHNQKRIILAKANGRRFSNSTEELFWPHREVMLMLKGKQRGLSLHDQDEDEVFEVTETKLVYHYSENI